MKWDEWSGWDRAIGLAVILVCAVALTHAVFGLSNVADLFLKPDAAGWVQAVGTIVALLIAVWVPKNIHQIEANERKERDMARAYIASIEVLHKTFPFLMHALTLRSQCEKFRQESSHGRRYDMDLNYLRERLPALPLPTESQMQDLIGAGGGIATDTARGVSFMVQIKAHLASVDESRMGANERANVELLDMYAANAIEHLQRAQEAMNGYLKVQDQRSTKLV